MLQLFFKPVSIVNLGLYLINGFLIYMFFIYHNPPHFKVVHSEYEANILIKNGDVLNGYLP